MTIDEILDKLEGVRVGGHEQWNARCPAHDDRRSSLTIGVRNGRVLMHCFAGCSFESIRAALGLGDKRILSDGKVSKRYKTDRKAYRVFTAAYYAPLSLRPLQLTHEWVYRYADGSQAFLVYRLQRPDGGKEIRPVMACEGGYRFGLPPAPRTLYRLPEILSSSGLVVVVEGEKACDAVVAAGWNATTSCGGASAAKNTDWSPLAFRSVVIWPDNDAPGIVYAKEVERTLLAIGSQVSICDPVGGPGDDAADCVSVDEVLLAGQAKTEHAA